MVRIIDQKENEVVTQHLPQPPRPINTIEHDSQYPRKINYNVEYTEEHEGDMIFVIMGGEVGSEEKDKVVKRTNGDNTISFSDKDIERVNILHK